MKRLTAYFFTPVVLSVTIALLFIVSRAEPMTVPCSLDGKPCPQRKECTRCLFCKEGNDRCCCLHNDKCTCPDPTGAGVGCCD